MKKNRTRVEQARNLSSSDLRQCLPEQLNLPLSNDCRLELYHAKELSDGYKEEIVRLFESNMKSFYEQSNDGYNPDEKRTELFDSESRYLLLRSANDLLAFVHFRFDMDDGSRVLYLYELQVNAERQGQGLGQCTVEQLKILCAKTGMSKIVLTVFKVNAKAVDFYRRKCHFRIDATNPDDEEEADYLILSFTV